MPRDMTLASCRSALLNEVPLMINQFKAAPVSTLVRRSKDLAKELRALADLLNDASTPESKIKDSLHSLIEGVAAAAFRTGGITVFDAHFEAHHPAVSGK